MQLRSACTNKTVMSTEDVVKSLFSLQRKISGCLHPSDHSLSRRVLTKKCWRKRLLKQTRMLGRLLAGSIFLEFLFSFFKGGKNVSEKEELLVIYV